MVVMMQNRKYISKIILSLPSQGGIEQNLVRPALCLINSSIILICNYESLGIDGE